MEALQAEAEAREDRQNEMSRQVDSLLEERDNLLKIRDQLTTKVNAMISRRSGARRRSRSQMTTSPNYNRLYSA